jgi:ubiquinone/menaquinone biosynthesis C-methylase UbiE
MTVQRDPEGNEARQLLDWVDFRGKRVLEIGCGDGRLTWKYAHQALNVVGIEVEHSDLRLALSDSPDGLRRSVFFARADSTHLPFANGSFEVALFSWSL